MSGVRWAGEAGARVGEAVSLPGLLAAAFDAFEVIRLVARASEDRVPGLFAAFMATADAAVDGREALTIAPSLPPGPSSVAAAGVAVAEARTGEVTAGLAALGVLLGERLAAAVAGAPTRGDREALAEAAEAGRRIAHLMAGEGDGGLW